MHSHMPARAVAYAHLLKLRGALLDVAAIRVALLAVNVRGLEVLGCLLA